MRPGPQVQGAKKTSFDETRDSIIDTAASLFARKGYASTGVQELGDAVGLARGALYYYIKSKDALLAAIHDRVLDPLLADATRVYELPISAPARLVLMSELLLRLILNYRSHVWVFLHEYRQLSGSDKVTFRNKRAEFEKFISSLINDGVHEGIFDVPDVRIATLSWLNMHNHTYHWISSEADMTVEKLSSAYSRTLLKGFSTTPFPFDGLDGELETGRKLLKDH